MSYFLLITKYSDSCYLSGALLSGESLQVVRQLRQVVENYPKRKYPTLTAAQWLLERLAAAQLDSARPNLDEHVLSRVGAESSRAVTALLYPLSSQRYLWPLSSI
jgi:hypothetical protein